MLVELRDGAECGPTASCVKGRIGSQHRCGRNVVRVAGFGGCGAPCRRGETGRGLHLRRNQCLIRHRSGDRGGAGRGIPGKRPAAPRPSGVNRVRRARRRVRWRDGGQWCRPAGVFGVTAGAPPRPPVASACRVRPVRKRRQAFCRGALSRRVGPPRITSSGARATTCHDGPCRAARTEPAFARGGLSWNSRIAPGLTADCASRS
jgi:hypothetical protein